MARKSTRRHRVVAARTAFAGSRVRLRVVPALVTVAAADRSLTVAWPSGGLKSAGKLKLALRKWPVTAAVLCGLLAPGSYAAADENKKPKPRKAKSATAVETVMDRQIRNAIDAGDGDLLTRSPRQKVVEEPSNVDARLALGAAYQRQGADELALEHYRIAAIEYGSGAAASRLARTLDELGESEQAVAVLVRFCDSHATGSSRILSELGILEDEMNNLSAGEHYHRRALAAALIENAPGQDALHSNLGYNLTAQKRFSEAEAQLRSALELNPRSEKARNNLAYTLSSAPAATSAQVNEAILHWQSLSGPAAAHNNLAAVYMEQGRYPEARRELERAIAFDRGSGAALKNLESLAALDGKPAQVAVALPAWPVQTTKANFFKRLFARQHKNDRQAAAGEVAAVTPARKTHGTKNQ